MIDGKLFNQPIRNDIKTYESIRKLSLVKEMTKQLIAYQNIFITKKIIN